MQVEMERWTEKHILSILPFLTSGGYRKEAPEINPDNLYDLLSENSTVFDADGNVIPNVFAAGETATAQLFGDYYFGGFSLGLYTTAGRIAAEQAVAEIQQ